MKLLEFRPKVVESGKNEDKVIFAMSKINLVISCYLFLPKLR